MLRLWVVVGGEGHAHLILCRSEEPEMVGVVQPFRFSSQWQGFQFPPRRQGYVVILIP